MYSGQRKVSIAGPQIIMARTTVAGPRNCRLLFLRRDVALIRALTLNEPPPGAAMGNETKQP